MFPPGFLCCSAAHQSPAGKAGECQHCLGCRRAASATCALVPLWELTQSWERPREGLLVLCRELSPENHPWGCLGVHSYLWCCSSHTSGTALTPPVPQGLVGNLLRGGFGPCQSRGERCPCVTLVIIILAPEEADLVKESSAADRESSRPP